MNVNNDNSQENVADLEKAMNFIGGSLLNDLKQCLEKIPPHCRNSQVVFQGIAAFLTNVIYKQSPGDPTTCLKSLETFTKLMNNNFENLPKTAETA